MTLERRDVWEVLEEFGLPPRHCLYGFELGRNDDDGMVRLETGSGIGGRLRAWKLVRTKGHTPPAVTTRKALRRLLREYLAGLSARPVERPGYITYARLNHNRFGQHWVWVQRQVNP